MKIKIKSKFQTARGAMFWPQILPTDWQNQWRTLSSQKLIRGSLDRSQPGTGSIDRHQSGTLLKDREAVKKGPITEDLSKLTWKGNGKTFTFINIHKNNMFFHIWKSGIIFILHCIKHCFIWHRQKGVNEWDTNFIFANC